MADIFRKASFAGHDRDPKHMGSQLTITACMRPAEDRASQNPSKDREEFMKAYLPLAEMQFATDGSRKGKVSLLQECITCGKTCALSNGPTPMYYRHH